MSAEQTAVVFVKLTSGGDETEQLAAAHFNELSDVDDKKKIIPVPRYPSSPGW